MEWEKTVDLQFGFSDTFAPSVNKTLSVVVKVTQCITVTHKSVEGSHWNPIRWIQRSASGIQLERLDPVGGADQPASTEMSQVVAWKLSFLIITNTKCY